MTKTRFTQWVVLACIGTLSACTSSEDGTVGNTEVNVIVPTNAGTPDAIDIQQIEYTIACGGNDATFLDNAASFEDQVRIDGNLEVVDGRTSFGAGSACNGGDNNGATCYPNRCTGGDNPGAPCNTPATPSLECQGTSPVADGSCDPSPNSVECGGTSPVADGSCETVADTGVSPGNQPLPNNQSEIWQGFMDLPPGICNIQLRARDGDGEVICTSDEPFGILPDVTTKVNVLLICKTSFQAPVGSLDVDSTFSFNVGNFCPDLFVFNATTSDPKEVTDVGIGIDVAATTLQARFRDGDNTCGNNCDPQDCAPSAVGLACSPGPDDGVRTTITCESDPPNSFQIDCFGNPESGDGGYLSGPDSCTIAGNSLGALPEFFEGVVPFTPIPCPDDDTSTEENEGDDFCATALGTDPGRFPDSCRDNVCDYSAYSVLLNASMGVAFFPPRGAPLFGPSGAIITCTATTTDGDVDCDKQKVLTLTGPGDSPCDALCGVGNAADCAACDDTVPPDTGNAGSGIGQCTGQVCSGDAVCSNPPVANNTVCTDAATPSGNGLCQDGVCVSADCNATGCPDDGNVCTALQVCNQTSGECEPATPAPVTDGTACDSGDGAGSGTCIAGGGTCGDSSCCVDNCAGVDCSDPGGDNQCTQNLCDPLGNAGDACVDQGSCCSNPPEPAGTTCTVNDPNDGACNGLNPPSCVLTVDYDPQTLGVDVACTNSVTTDVSILPFVLTVDPGPMAAGGGYTAALSGGGEFSEAFLDVAQIVIKCGTASGQVLNLAATVALRNTGAAGETTGADVQLPADFDALENRCAASGIPCPDTPLGTNDPPCTFFGGPPAPVNTCQQGFATVPTTPGSPNTAGGCDPGPAPGCGVPDCDCSDCADLDLSTCTPGIDCIKEAQCQANGFCVAGGLPIPIASGTGNYTAGDSGTDILYGWFDGNPPTTNSDGTLVLPLPASSFEPLGLDVSAGGLIVALRCLMGVDSAGVNGVSTCQNGGNPGVRCFSPADLVGDPNGDNFCASGDRAGLPCDPAITGAPDPDPCPNADCTGFNCACENDECGLLADGVTAADCAPTDTGSPTPDALLNTFVVP